MGGLPSEKSKYQLTAMVCYYGHHYMAIAASASLKCWLFFDDKRVTRIGTWADVIQRCDRAAGRARAGVVDSPGHACVVHLRCVKGRLQPTMLIYEALQVRTGAAAAAAAVHAVCTRVTWPPTPASA